MVIAAFRCRLNDQLIMRRLLIEQLIAMDEAIARPHVLSRAYVRWTLLARTLGVKRCTSMCHLIARCAYATLLQTIGGTLFY